MSSGSIEKPVAAPYAATSNSVRRVMVIVMAALVPATLFGFWLYGWPAVYLWMISVAAAALGEAFCLRLMGRDARTVLGDGSAWLTGWLLALSLPPWAPWWIGVCGGLFATVLGKQVFGGLGQNLFNPAMVGRVALLISFPVQMTAWVAPLPIFDAAAPGPIAALAITLKGMQPAFDAVASASLLGFAKTEMARGVDLAHSLLQAPLQAWYGSRPGSLGETASWLIVAGGVAMICLRTITWHIPVAMLLGIAVPAALLHAVDPARYLDAGTHLLSGGAMLGAFFIATDYVTSPNTPRGQIVFGTGCGVLTYVIRTWAGYPEGVAFAVLLMNSLTPVIDSYIKPRIYGRDRRGAALEPGK
ncbi:MAG: RnfABCDGE type electron transport complex subunit D [Candidatus Accumulibacter phosphatis]|jgi:electron transport complex protein RnfD|uniref:Ion-translocating oxidoreductase complex subunit D n=2 Tax=Candidatus Accumulibacter TaxID=327159 RepID=A0A080M0X4_9PROT|nr:MULTISPECIES: RnfABCDGE type electron transport complex subunit D [Candidatus Accumulibacter]KFB70864.1 MAG: Nitrogen fixation protein RnfD [Candidatus Accumulibacter phosphatis]NMQ05507.1 RnfABCDGE type electron transport complex subunit D [Candidatus Accumulibacter contiguus]HRF10656.1 RnfABCDGE type electron transport complex subunit D [Candidatus Accumulibacter phosphatis]